MERSTETNLALFLDFDNIALGARKDRLHFNIDLLLQRLLEKGKIIVKKAYADWSHHQEYMTDLHRAGVEMIEIPRPEMSGKNSADIRLVVDAMELCHGKAHLDTFVIVSGDSDFSPLVAKLRENNRSVIGVGMKGSSSRLLIACCDEFIFYDDVLENAAGEEAASLDTLPEEKGKLFDFLLSTIQGLFREGREFLYSSLIKDTMKRKRPDFNESNFGYSTFGDLLEDAMANGLLEVVRQEKAGGTWVVTSLSEARKAPRRRRRRKPRGKASSASPVEAAEGKESARQTAGTSGSDTRRKR